uniref:Uncharacterized protein n=1 Tax=viral metagenome TaxID=1070528 RepID=A0A6C0HG68_9ZZZZ
MNLTRKRSSHKRSGHKRSSHKRSSHKRSSHKRSSHKRSSHKNKRSSRNGGGRKTKTIKFVRKLTPIHEVDEATLLKNEQIEDSMTTTYKGVKYVRDPSETGLQKLQKWLEKREKNKAAIKSDNEFYRNLQLWQDKQKEKEMHKQTA